MTIPSLPSSSIVARDGLCINADASTEFAIEDNNGSLPFTSDSEVIDDIGGENEQHSLTNQTKNLFPAMNDPMPNAGDTMVGKISSRPVRRSERNRGPPPAQPSTEPHQCPTTRSRLGKRSLSPQEKSGRAGREPHAATPAASSSTGTPAASSSTSSTRTPTRRSTRVMDLPRAGPSRTPLPDAFSATKPFTATCRFANIHRVMKHAMVEAKKMLQGKKPIGSGRYIDSQEKYLAAMSVLPYCPQTGCGVGDRSAMLYFATYRELNKHTRLFHPDIETIYQPPEAKYHEMLRLLGF